MNAQIIDGQALAEEIKDKIVKEILKLNKDKINCLNQRPNLAVILVGKNADSLLYVDKKINTAKLVGIDTHLYKCAEDSGQKKLLEMIDFLNNDKEIDAIMVQLPLPKDKDYDVDAIIARIKPEKDVDRFHAINIEPIKNICDSELILPPVFKAILEMLKSIDYELEYKIVTIISNSKIFGNSLAKTLSCRGASALVVKPDAEDLVERCLEADVLIPAIGQPKLITGSMIKEDVVIIDVGITRDMGSVKGDVDAESCKEKAAYISPVPGGVGPMTVALTLKNTLELYKRQCK
ncbi:bifunctional 5,10-methylenetetrahydrofolate dehydrogenase/5,10-methenyltetrahydrofolate cyclohydrolase [Candidatus Parcubacteria bacterium]|nr:bifunctional 5,10-methylenetetrahydrofolate dehydrogenase/5,10-methenyltetrahydrofolate cyclohydrolase [Candidatus Parcubacteria bacterium]